MDGITFASQLQPEIQCIILKIVIVDYLSSISNPHDMLSQLVSMMGCHFLLDDIISMAIQELEFDASVETWEVNNSFFNNAHFEKFADFILARSIKLKSIKITPILTNSASHSHSEDEKVYEILDSRCENVVSLIRHQYSPEDNALKKHRYLFPMKYVSSLNCMGVLFPTPNADVFVSELIQSTRLNKLTLNLCSPREIHLFKNVLQILNEQHYIRNDKLSFYIRCKLYSSLLFREHLSTLTSLNSILNISAYGNLKFAVKLTAIQFNFNWSSPLITDKYRDFLVKSKVHTVGIRFPLHTAPAYFSIFEILNQLPFLKNLNLRPSMTPFTDYTSIPTLIVSNPNIARISLSGLPLEFKFNYPNQISKLRQLTLTACILSPLNFASIPETLHELSIYECMVKPSKYDCDTICAVKLPIKLQILKISGNRSCLTLPEIINLDQLLGLKKVSILLHPQIEFQLSNPLQKRFSEGELATSFTLQQLQKSISKLSPHSLTSFSIVHRGYIFDRCQFCCPNGLSFEHLIKLNDLTFDCRCYCKDDSFFHLSMFPPELEHLNFTPHHNLTGQLPSHLRSLDINMKNYSNMYQPVQFICNTFIFNLQNLRILKIQTLNNNSVDLRNVQLPKHICSFELIFYPVPARNIGTRNHLYVVLDGVFPLNLELNFVCLDFGWSEHIIVVDDCLGESIQSVKKQIHVDGRKLSDWVLFDHDYSSFVIPACLKSTLYMSL
ncbi:unnamed protein product [Ambrosiozyma monospora]|uniref:Unnamed protein product n=1 Tax=Ambrosiozyma monospora TaxID=43982 RepID=A0A9W6YSB4_AMBMO|nr:unnamed protein product [Ambrosiozyma monospora]